MTDITKLSDWMEWEESIEAREDGPPIHWGWIGDGLEPMIWVEDDEILTPAGAVAVLEKMSADRIIWTMKRGNQGVIIHVPSGSGGVYEHSNDFCTAVRDAALAYLANH